MGKDNDLSITPSIETFRTLDHDGSGTLSHAETKNLSRDWLTVLLAKAGQDSEKGNLPSFFSSLPISRLAEVVQGAQENRFLPLFQGLLHDLAQKHLSKVACIMDELIDTDPQLADGLLLNLDEGYWPSLMTMLEPTCPAYVLSRTTLPYTGALLTIDANQDHRISSHEVTEVSSELLDVIMSNLERPEVKLAASFVIDGLSETEWTALYAALDTRIQDQNRQAQKDALVPVVDALGFKEALSSKTPVLVEFGANWCPPCRLSLPLLEEIASRNGPHVKIIRVDIDRSPELFRLFPSEDIPYFVCFKNGEIIATEKGLPRTEAGAKAMLQELIRRCYGTTL